MSTYNFTGKFWYDVFLVYTKNMSNQNLPVKL